MAENYYDAGMLIALDRNKTAAWEHHLATRRRGLRPVVPAPVLAQVWRGGPSVNLSRALKGCKVVEFAADHAKPVGELCAATGTSDVVDAHVAHVGRHSNSLIFSSDQDEIRALVQAGGYAAEVISV
jgi:hypothetical protein